MKFVAAVSILVFALVVPSYAKSLRAGINSFSIFSCHCYFLCVWESSIEIEFDCNR